MKKKTKRRHETAKTTVEVFRLFKIRDFARVIEKAKSSVIAALGMQIRMDAAEMLSPYCAQQQRLIDAAKAKHESVRSHRPRGGARKAGAVSARARREDANDLARRKR